VRFNLVGLELSSINEFGLDLGRTKARSAHFRCARQCVREIGGFGTHPGPLKKFKCWNLKVQNHKGDLMLVQSIGLKVTTSSKQL